LGKLKALELHLQGLLAKFTNEHSVLEAEKKLDEFQQAKEEIRTFFIGKVISQSL